MSAGTTTYQVNALGQRVRKTNSSTDTVFTYDSRGHLIAENTAAGALVKEYAWLGDMPLAVSDATATYFIHTDHLNTPRLVANAAGTTVWKWDQQEAFGDNVADENPAGLGNFEFPQRFPGQYFDKETQVAYSYFRDCYDPSTGRFCEPDPIGVALYKDVAFRTVGSLGISMPELATLLFNRQPQYNHLYGYVGGNSLTYSDPLGLFWPYDCYRCWKSSQRMEDALRECRKEYDNCKTLREQIEYAEKYGGGYISTAIYNCATAKDPNAFSEMINRCGACGVAPKGPWPIRR